MKLTKITEYKNNKALTIHNSIIDYEPKNIYIPLFDNNEKYESFVKENDYVKVGQIVAQSIKNHIPSHSSISGIVKSINKKMYTNYNLLVNCIEIENDFKNTKIEYINDLNYKNLYTKEFIINRIKDNGIVGMGGAGFQTYLKYINKNISYLIINGCECEPFITCDYRLMYEQSIKLINGIHYILKAIDGKKAYICIKEHYVDIYNILSQYVNEKIEIIKVPNLYPVGYERYLVEKITNKKYDKIPIEVDCVVNNIQTIIAIYNAVKYNLPLIKRVVTITGYCLDKQVNINLKIGTNIEEILNNVCMIKHKYQKINLIAGGPMTGKSILSTNLIVTKTLNSVIINPCLENETKFLPCIGCGKCAEVCPVKLTPTEIIKYYNKKDINQLKSLKADYCIRCGLCSYICPSRIELTINTSKASDFVKRGLNDK